MKKIMALVLVLSICLSICACGKNQEQTMMMDNDVSAVQTDGSYTIDDLIGVWHSEGSRQMLSVGPDITSRRSFAPDNSSLDDRDYQVEIEGDIVSYSRLGEFQIKQADGVLILSCIETGKIAKGTEFLKVENKATKEELHGSWYSLTTGNFMEIVDGKVHINNKQKTIYHETDWTLQAIHCIFNLSLF